MYICDMGHEFREPEYKSYYDPVGEYGSATAYEYVVEARCPICGSDWIGEEEEDD